MELLHTENATKTHSVQFLWFCFYELCQSVPHTYLIFNRSPPSHPFVFFSFSFCVYVCESASYTTQTRMEFTVYNVTMCITPQWIANIWSDKRLVFVLFSFGRIQILWYFSVLYWCFGSEDAGIKKTDTNIWIQFLKSCLRLTSYCSNN